MTTRGRCLGAALAPLGAVLWVTIAHAQGTPVRIEATDCPVDLGAAVESALDVELSMATPAARVGLADGTLRCALACDDTGTTVAVVRGTDRVEQRIEGHGPGLARRLAIALAELLDASASAVGGAPAPADAVTESEAIVAITISEPEPAPEPRGDAAPDRLVTRLRVAGGAWLGGEPLLALGALEVGVELAPIDHVAIVLGAAGALGALDVDAGRLDVRLVSAHASVRLGGAWGPLWLGGGPAVRGGAVLWTGTARDRDRATGRDTTGGWLGLGAIAAAFVRAGETPLRVGIEAEGGGIAVHSEALALGARAARVGTGWLELRLAVDLALE